MTNPAPQKRDLMSDRDAAFQEYFAARSDVMRGTAYLLCGDWHRAEDLVQQAFTKLYLVWRRIERHEALDAYTRQVLVRTFLSERRRGWFRFESASDDFADSVAPAGVHVEERMVLLEALAKGAGQVLPSSVWGLEWPVGQTDRTATNGPQADRAQKLLGELKGAVPAGYDAPQLRYQDWRYNGGDMQRTRGQVASDRGVTPEVWQYTAQTPVRENGRVGWLLAEVSTPNRALPAEPCALARTFWGMGGECAVVLVDGLEVGVVQRNTSGRDQFDKWATYRARDGQVVTIAQDDSYEGGGYPEARRAGVHRAAAGRAGDRSPVPGRRLTALARWRAVTAVAALSRCSYRVFCQVECRSQCGLCSSTTTTRSRSTSSSTWPR
ncbi:sigma factor [Lentzea sp. CC55]|uniref:sigma factor n=1 Tax=Lentzea sp. CC55 TaxID=2884909 RepID=UPI0027DEBE9E|nr:sigma factor [Lentzea sp. CC55]MCG8922290.1 hypothetical protein [Lentzea sp. CC55]